MADNTEHLERLPNELYLVVAEDPCLSTRDLYHFALANRRYATLTIPALYRKNIKEENASARKSSRTNQHTTGIPVGDMLLLTLGSPVLWAVLNENTETLALLLLYGADINSVEASLHLHQSPPYRWIKRLCQRNFHSEDTTRRTRHANMHRRAQLPGNFMFTNQSPATMALATMPGALGPLVAALGLQESRRDVRFTALALAVREGLTEMVKWLLENGADPDVPALNLCRCDNEPKKSRGMWRFSPGAGGQPVEPPHWTALHLAVHYDRDDIVELLVAHGADTHQVCRPEDGACTVLHSAFIHKRESIIKSLMYRYQGTNMVDINAGGRGGITPLHIAYCLESKSLVDLALKFGAYVNLEYQFDRNQWTLFSMACAEQDWSFALRLLKLGATADFDLEARSGGRWTINDFLSDVESRLHRSPFDCAAATLLDEIDRLLRDHEVAWL